MNSVNQFCIHPETHVRDVEGRGLNPSHCGACECPIVGKMYNCTCCNSDLHPFCKSCPPCFSSFLHPGQGHHLTFLPRDTNILHPRRCTVCDEAITGISYTCSPCHFDVHPQCSQLPRRVPCSADRGQFLELQLGEIYNVNCDVCQSECGRWVYRCDACSVNIHYWCLLNDVRGGSSLPADAAAPHHDRSLGAWGGPTHLGFHCHGGGASPWPTHQYPFFPNYYGQGYGPGVPNYYNNRPVGFQNHANPLGGNSYNNISGTGIGGGGTGGLINFMVAKMGSLAVNVLCNLFADSIQQDFFSS